MHQTFYIDIDEEISSVIDRLGKSMSFDNFFVVPKRAIMLQSAVNLKLLKREADKIGKRVYIVTTDESGMALAKRSGIDVLKSLEGVSSEDDASKISQEIFENEESQDGFLPDPEEKAISHLKDSRLGSVGSSDFYGDSNVNSEIKSHKAKAPKHTNHVGSGRPAAGNVKRQGMDMRIPKSVSLKSVLSQTHPTRRKKDDPDSVFLDTEREDKIEKMFLSPRKEETIQEVPIKNGKTKKVFFSLVVFSVFVLAGVAAYLFVPSASITVQPNLQTVESDLSISSGQNLQVGNSSIPLKVINKSDTITLQYDATGKSSASGQKAHGSVVISNSFSADPQVLVTGTRLQSQDGHIFHLVKSVTVPGMRTIAGEAKPGAIEADITADQAGSDYNIDPTTFTIPGFQGGPKFAKFSAQSTVAMTGGTTNGDAGGQTIVSQQDIDSAKTKTEAALKQKITDEIKATFGQGDVLLDDAQQINISSSSASVKAANSSANFNYTAQATIEALVFSENDLKTLVIAATAKGDHPANAQSSISSIDYGPSQADFTADTLNLQVHAQTLFTPKIDLAKLKQEVLGKDTNQLSDVVRQNSNIKGLNVTFNPPFISRIPQYPLRVSIKIDTTTTTSQQ
jgi:hypothetical protein